MKIFRIITLLNLAATIFLLKKTKQMSQDYDVINGLLLGIADSISEVSEDIDKLLGEIKPQGGLNESDAQYVISRLTAIKSNLRTVADKAGDTTSTTTILPEETTTLPVDETTTILPEETTTLPVDETTTTLPEETTTLPVDETTTTVL